MREIVRPQQTDARQAYYRRIAPARLFPLWERFKDLLPFEPTVASRPFQWRYADARPALIEAADIISAEEAERRVLVLENPGLEGASAITETLYAGVQLLMPGEVAPAHRHSPSALRFLLESDGRAYTAVDGERAWMEPGDLILTPSMRWHDHGHEGREPVIWLDVLDMPLVANAGPVFLDPYGDSRYPERRPPDASRSLYGANMRPPGHVGADASSPVIRYPYAEARAALTAVAASEASDPRHGHILEYIDPTTGRPALATISTFLQLMPAGFRSAPHNTTEGRVFSVVEGAGEVTIGAGDQQATYSYAPRDTLAAPCWAPVSWRTDSDTVVFTASDRGVQQKLGLWREQTDTNGAGR
ncbi:MAG: cupin domain-containing protein [Caulobacterales bacterium]|nr:cupin domain-containing protein [Caulobacterales bacterium]